MAKSGKTKTAARNAFLAVGAAIVLATMGTAYQLRSQPSLAQGDGSRAMEMEQLSKHTHVHGLAVDRSDPDHLLIATHHELFRTRSDGKAERVSEVQDFMGFSRMLKNFFQVLRLAI